MKKAFTILLLILIFFIIYFLQANFFSWFTIAGVMPNLFVIYVLIIGLFAGKWTGLSLGFLFGFYIDIMNGKLVGISAIILCLVGFLAEFVYKNISNDNKATLILIVAVNTVLFELFCYIVSIWRLGVSMEIFSFIRILLIETFYNILIIIITYPIIQKSSIWMSNIFKNKNFTNKIFMV